MCAQEEEGASHHLQVWDRSSGTCPELCASVQPLWSCPMCTRSEEPHFLLSSSGIFAFKCSRAEEIFNLLQDLMQCNSINVMEEPVIITRNSHPTELDLPRAPQPPNGEETPPLAPQPPHPYACTQAWEAPVLGAQGRQAGGVAGPSTLPGQLPAIRRLLGMNKSPSGPVR